MSYLPAQKSTSFISVLRCLEIWGLVTRSTMKYWVRITASYGGPNLPQSRVKSVRSLEKPS